MRSIPWSKALLTLPAILLAASTGSSLADDLYNLNQTQNGFELPGVSLPQGQDEVRAADGTTCRSAVSGSGAYLDMGVIRNGKSEFNSNDLATYGRIVIPIGRTPKRMDCTRLYKLEVERLQMELDLLKMGLAPNGSDITGAVAAKGKTKWSETGWSDGK